MFANRNAGEGAGQQAVPVTKVNTAKTFPPAMGGDRGDEGVIPRERNAGVGVQSSGLPPGMGGHRDLDY